MEPEGIGAVLVVMAAASATTCLLEMSSVKVSSSIAGCADIVSRLKPMMKKLFSFSETAVAVFARLALVCILVGWVIGMALPMRLNFILDLVGGEAVALALSMNMLTFAVISAIATVVWSVTGAVAKRLMRWEPKQ